MREPFSRNGCWIPVPLPPPRSDKERTTPLESSDGLRSWRSVRPIAKRLTLRSLTTRNRINTPGEFGGRRFPIYGDCRFMRCHGSGSDGQRRISPRVPSSRQAHCSRQARFSRTDVDGVYEWLPPSAVVAHIQVGHFALSRSAMAAMRASATIPAWSKAVNLPERRRMRPSTITVSTFVGRPSETIAS
jgi:hypothetical protein